MRKYSFVVACLWLLSTYLDAQKISGLTFVATPRPISEKSVDEVRNVNAGWVTLVPYGFQRGFEGDLVYNLERQWWGERHEGIEECIQKCRKKGIKIMIKPQIWVRGQWIGELDYTTEAAWKKWEKQYKDYIMSYVTIAVKHNVEMICIGTEIRNSASKRPQFWKNLIKDIRQTYKGKLTYSANWDDYKKITFWKEMDYIGISSYYPLSTSITPTVKELVSKWQPVKSELARYSKRFGKKILFTEYGYLTVDGCAGKTWELEKNMKTLSKNEHAQRNAFEALFSVFWKEDFWAGGFLWKWFPDGMGHEGQPDKDYTPQGKLAEGVVRKWYGM
jgi:hypothetical protein